MDYFKTHKKDLLWMANTEAGRYLLGLKENLPITNIFPNGYTFTKENKSVMRMYIADKSAELLLPILTKFDIAAEDEKIRRIIEENTYKSFIHFSGLEKYKQLPQIYLADVYNASGTGVASIYKADGGTTWANTRDAASGQGTRAGSGDLYLQVSDQSGGGFIIERVYYPIDTSAIVSAGAIVSAIFYFTVKATVNPDGGIGNISLIQTTQTSPTAIAVGDFSKQGTTEGSDSRASGTSTGEKTLALNATGLGWISDSTYTKFGIREYTYDVVNTPTALENGNVLWGAADSDHYAHLDVTLPSVGGRYYRTLLGVGT